MKKLLWVMSYGFGVILVLLLTLNSQLITVSAHVLESSGSIGAVLHIDPEDDPIAGQPAGFFFDFKDKQNKFKPEKCDCTFVVLENGQQIYSQPLFQGNASPSLTSASVFYTFPKKDVYQVQVKGKPLKPNDFEPFTLKFDIRVAREGGQLSSSNSDSAASWIFFHLIHILGGVIIVGFLIFAVIKRSRY